MPDQMQGLEFRHLPQLHESLVLPEDIAGLFAADFHRAPH